MTDAALSVRSLREDLSAGRTTARDLVELFAERIEAENSHWHCYRETTLDAARRVADGFDRHGASQEDVLSGIPVGVKDVFTLEGAPARSSSAVVPDPNLAESGLSRSLREKGSPILGLQTCHEFAFGPLGDVSFPVATLNPRDASLVPGGSSSGSAVAVATGLAPLSFATDTGGSIRTPAAFNGLVGFMPAYGGIDASGMNHLSPSLDRIGPIAADVDSARLGWLSLTGADAAVRPLPRLDLTDIRIGVLSGPSFDQLDDIVGAGYDGLLSSLGRRRPLRSCVIDTSSALAAHATIVAADAWRLYGTLAEDPLSGLGPEVAERIRAGARVNDAGYAHALRQAKKFDLALQDLFAGVDLLICPTTPVAIPHLGERERRRTDDSVEHVYRDVTKHTSPFNVANASALTVPYDLSPPNPLAVQIVARPGDEEHAFALATIIERNRQR